MARPNQRTAQIDQYNRSYGWNVPMLSNPLDDTDNVIGSKIVESSDNAHELDALDFVASAGVKDGLT